MTSTSFLSGTFYHYFVRARQLGKVYNQFLLFFFAISGQCRFKVKVGRRVDLKKTSWSIHTTGSRLVLIITMFHRGMFPLQGQCARMALSATAPASASTAAVTSSAIAVVSPASSVSSPTLCNMSPSMPTNSAATKHTRQAYDNTADNSAGISSIGGDRCSQAGFASAQSQVQAPSQ